MNKTLHYTIKPEEAGLTVGCFLRKQGYSRHILTHLKQTEHGICLGSAPVYTSAILRSGDRLTVRIIEEHSSGQIQPAALPFPIVFEDEDILVIDKPAGMPVHPSQGNHGNTLANSAAWYFHQQGVPYVFRCINRIDRDTSGLLILAKHMLSAAVLSKDLKEHRIRRTYLAMTTGRLTPGEGTVRAPIGRCPHSILERQVDPLGEEAVTHYRVLVSSDQASLASFSLETGRTHQIRVHMKYLGHPLLGDFLYNPGNHDCPRQALHSCRLEFSHPISGKMLTFNCPLPDDMKACLKRFFPGQDATLLF